MKVKIIFYKVLLIIFISINGNSEDVFTIGYSGIANPLDSPLSVQNISDIVIDCLKINHPLFEFGKKDIDVQRSLLENTKFTKNLKVKKKGTILIIYIGSREAKTEDRSINYISFTIYVIATSPKKFDMKQLDIDYIKKYMSSHKVKSLRLGFVVPKKLTLPFIEEPKTIRSEEKEHTTTKAKEKGSNHEAFINIRVDIDAFIDKKKFLSKEIASTEILIEKKASQMEIEESILKLDIFIRSIKEYLTTFEGYREYMTELIFQNTNNSSILKEASTIFNILDKNIIIMREIIEDITIFVDSIKRDILPNEVENIVESSLSRRENKKDNKPFIPKDYNSDEENKDDMAIGGININYNRTDNQPFIPKDYSNDEENKDDMAIGGINTNYNRREFQKRQKILEKTLAEGINHKLTKLPKPRAITPTFHLNDSLEKLNDYVD